MFFPGSRYLNAGTYTVTGPDGVEVKVTKLPLPQRPPLLGFHQRRERERLDLIANFFLKDATTFWRLCDANNAICPDALSARSQVGIPPKASR